MGTQFRKAKLTQSAVTNAKPETRRFVLTDTAIPGFWLMVEPSGRKTFKLRYRVGGGRGGTVREPKIGDAVALKAEAARKIAAEWHADVKRGGDPGGKRQAYRNAPTIATLLDRYLTDHARPHKKASSLAEDERLIRDYLKPALGARKAIEVTREQVDTFHKSLRHKPYRANRCVALLSKAFNLAEVWGMRPDNTNPCRHLQRFTERKRKRFLSVDEMQRLGDVLRSVDRDGFVEQPRKAGVNGRPTHVPISPSAIAAIRLLLFTGARRGEILGLRWDWIDMARGRAALPDSKTGEKVLILPPPALSVLSAIPKREDNPFIIAGGKPGAALVNLKDPWRAIREAALINDVRLHDLRHSFASVGAAGGASLYVIGALLGHSQPSTTSRYAHLQDDPLQSAAERIGNRIAADLGDTPSSRTSPLRAIK